jgi:hypothetical protein
MKHRRQLTWQIGARFMTSSPANLYFIFVKLKSESAEGAHLL